MAAPIAAPANWQAPDTFFPHSPSLLYQKPCKGAEEQNLSPPHI